MKVKAIKLLISNIYYQGLYDGMDIAKGSNDRFFGNQIARGRWEKDHLAKWYLEFKEIHE